MTGAALFAYLVAIVNAGFVVYGAMNEWSVKECFQHFFAAWVLVIAGSALLFYA